MESCSPVFQGSDPARGARGRDHREAFEVAPLLASWQTKATIHDGERAGSDIRRKL